MKMKTYLVRKEWATVCNEYIIVVTPQLVQDYEECIKRDYIFAEDVEIKLTEQDLINAWEREYEYAEEPTILNTKVLGVRYRDGSTHEYPSHVELGDIIQEILSDEMWERDYDCIEYNTDDVHDCIEHYDI